MTQYIAVAPVEMQGKFLDSAAYRPLAEAHLRELGYVRLAGSAAEADRLMMWGDYWYHPEHADRVAAVSFDVGRKTGRTVGVEIVSGEQAATNRRNMLEARDRVRGKQS